MSRLVGIVALIIAFGWSGFILYRLAYPNLLHRGARIEIKPKPNASIDVVHRDLCSLAEAEVEYGHLTGRYAEITELAREGRTTVPDSRWPYHYMLYVPPSSNRFQIIAVSLTPIESQPRILQIDEQLQVQTRTRPPQIFPCAADNALKPRSR